MIKILLIHFRIRSWTQIPTKFHFSEVTILYYSKVIMKNIQDKGPNRLMWDYRYATVFCVHLTYMCLRNTVSITRYTSWWRYLCEVMALWYKMGAVFGCQGGWDGIGWNRIFQFRDQIYCLSFSCPTKFGCFGDI